MVFQEQDFFIQSSPSAFEGLPKLNSAHQRDRMVA